jgi:hypothetical protein
MLKDFTVSHYQGLLSYIGNVVFRKKEALYGYGPDDILHGSLEKAILFFQKNPDKANAIMRGGKKKFESYLYATVKANSKQFLFDLYRYDEKRRQQIVETMKSDIDLLYVDWQFEKIDDTELIDKLCPSYRALIRMMREQMTVREIMQKFGMTSVRQFYRARANMLDDIEKLSGEKV